MPTTSRTVARPRGVGAGRRAPAKGGDAPRSAAQRVEKQLENIFFQHFFKIFPKIT